MQIYYIKEYVYQRLDYHQKMNPCILWIIIP